MAQPASRSDLKDYCLRRLGFPVIDINVDDDQLDDRIDDALQKFREFHFDGTTEGYLGVKITQTIIDNQYFSVPDSIIAVNRLLPVSGANINSGSKQGFNIFDINYQIRLNDFYNLTASSYTYYVIAREHLSMLDMIVTGEIPFSYNKKTGQVNLFMDVGSRANVGDYIVFHVMRIVDQDSYESVFNDSWLKEYTTASFKQQWGANLTKYANYTLPGGLVVNGEKIYNDATEDLLRLEEKLRDTYEMPTPMLVG